MPEIDDSELTRFHPEIPMRTTASTLRGSGSYDWGMQNRLARIFGPDDGHTLMLAVDHGYFQGPVRGLERVDLNIVPLLEQVDALMLTRGILRTSIPATTQAPIVLRASGGPSILKELSNEHIAVEIEDALRLDVAALAVQVYIGGEFEAQTTRNLTRIVDAGMKYGLPVLGVTAVGRDMVRDAKYFRLACRICAELGAQMVKTYYVHEGFETVAASCPVPIIVAGGKKVEESDALAMVKHAMDEGASGVDMGRNVFQSERSKAMLGALRGIVHSGWSARQALEVLQEIAEQDEIAVV